MEVKKVQSNSSPFYSLLNTPPTGHSESGKAIIDDYVLKVVDGQEVLVKCGKIDLVTPKKEALEGTYLPRMIERFTKGALSPADYDKFLNTHSWSDVDVTKMPKNLAEFNQLQIDSERAFMSMPSDVRDLFGNNKYKFVEAVQNGKARPVLEAAGYVRKAAVKQTKVPEIKKEVKANE